MSPDTGAGRALGKPFTSSTSHIVCTSVAKHRNPRGSALTRYKPPQSGHYRASALLLPSNVHHTTENTGKCLFSEGNKKILRLCFAFY